MCKCSYGLHSEGDLGLRADTLFPVQKPEEEITLQSEHIAHWPTVIGRLVYMCVCYMSKKAYNM